MADTHSTTAFGRRSFLGLAGGALGAGVLAACGDNTGRSDGSSTSGGSLRLSQWYHQYGEDGTQQAVERYAKEYPDATVTVQWNPGDYDKKARRGAADRRRSGRLRVRQRPHAST